MGLLFRSLLAFAVTTLLMVTVRTVAPRVLHPSPEVGTAGQYSRLRGSLPPADHLHDSVCGLYSARRSSAARRTYSFLPCRARLVGLSFPIPGQGRGKTSWMLESSSIAV